METIIGQEKIIALFDRLLKEGQLHHAYALVGPTHIGKKTLALHLASQMLSIPVARLPLHPDFLRIDRVDEDGDLKKDITVDHIEQITKKIIRPPVMAKMHVVIIPEAEKMNIFAANSLLKTLEEPPTPTVFFLLAQNEEKLLGTIRSRVQCIRLERSSDAEILGHIQQMEEAKENTELEDIATLAQGLPGLAVAWMQNPESFASYKKEIQRFFSLFGKPLYEKLALVEDLYSEKKAHLEGRAELDRVLRIWLHGVDLALNQKQSSKRVVVPCPQVSTGTLLPFCDMILEAQELLNKNVHPRLLIEHLLLCLP